MPVYLARRSRRLGQLTMPWQSLTTPSGKSAFETILATPLDPYGTFELLKNIDVGSIPGTSSLGDLLQNAFDGTLTDSQVQAIAQQNAQGLVSAGMSPADAQKQALSDVHAVLTLNQADPSQSVITATGNAAMSSSLWDWVLVIGAGALGVWAVSRAI